MKGFELLNTDPATLLFILLLTLAVNISSSFLMSYGWRNSAKKEAELCKEIMAISTDGDMDECITRLKESVSNRVTAALLKRDKALSVWGQFKLRLPALIAAMILCWSVTAPIVSAQGWSLELFVTYAFYVALDSVGIQFVFATIAATIKPLIKREDRMSAESKNNGQDNPTPGKNYKNGS